MNKLLLIVLFLVFVVLVFLWYRKSTKDSLIFILADWCGYCTKLKESGVINKMKKYINVTVLSDTHSSTKKIMNSVQAQGFPCIVLKRNGGYINYTGDRSLQDLIKFVS